jgi:hypothetical protein
MAHTPEDDRKHREANEPSNLDVIGAYAPSDHLELFWVGNTAQDRIYVLASSWRNAKIIAMMGGHIRHLRNGQRWKVMISTHSRTGVGKAIRHGMPGVVWVREGCAVHRDKVFYDDR